MELDRFSTVFDAFAKGRVSVDQAQGILAGLKKLPADLPSAASDTAQTMMVHFADQFDPDDLRRMSRAIWERLDPDGFDSADAARLEAEQRSAEQHRCLSIVPDGWLDDYRRIGSAGRRGTAAGARRRSCPTAAIDPGSPC